MSRNVEKGKHISVLVEQSFPTCLLVSFKLEGKTFRGVLLDESSQTVIRTSPSDVLGKAHSSANLGLTTARATTCQSKERHGSNTRVNTRSSSMILREGGMTSSEAITPVCKIRGLVESLKSRPRRSVPDAQLENPNSSVTSPEQNEALSGSKKPQPANESNPNTTKPTKRKRDGTLVTNTESLSGPPNVKTSQNISHKSSPEKSEQKMSAAKSPCPLSRSGGSPLFPVLKLRKTKGSENSYVAVAMFNSQKCDLPVNDKDKGEQPLNKNSGKPLDSSEGSTAGHEHNTRFKARKGSERGKTLLVSEEKVDNRSSASVHHGGSLIKVMTESQGNRSQLNGNATDVKPKANAMFQCSSKACRGLKQRSVFSSQNMRVGDIVWGKVHGHPWWPGRILAILCNASENDGGFQIVKVSWYGSTTTSDISCRLLLAFKENFKQLFKKQKKGAYRLAVRQAQQDLDLCLSDTQVIPA